MMIMRSVLDLRDGGEIRKYLASYCGVGLDDLVLFVCELSGFCKYGVRNTDLSGVMEKRFIIEILNLIFREAHALCDLH